MGEGAQFWGVALAVLAAGVGAVCRLIVDGAVTVLVSRTGRSAHLPWGILVVNLTGSLALGVLLGILAGGSASESWLMLAAIGALGGYTTFSTASVDAVRLVRERRWAAALGAGPGMLVAAIACAVVGFFCGGLLA